MREEDYIKRINKFKDDEPLIRTAVQKIIDILNEYGHKLNYSYGSRAAILTACVVLFMESLVNIEHYESFINDFSHSLKSEFLGERCPCGYCNSPEEAKLKH